MQYLEQYVPEAWRSWESEGGRPVKPGGQHRAWLCPLTSWTSEETQWTSNDLGVLRVRYGTPRLIYYHHHQYYYNYYYFCLLHATCLANLFHSFLLKTATALRYWIVKFLIPSFFCPFSSLYTRVYLPQNFVHKERPQSETRSSDTCFKPKCSELLSHMQWIPRGPDGWSTSQYVLSVL
jgi:hypothetical protein